MKFSFNIRKLKMAKFRRYRRKALMAALTILLTLTSFQIWNYFSPEGIEAAWMDDSFAYRQRFTFTHNTAISADRAITFSLDTAELITDGVMQSDCDDTRFADVNGNPLLYDLTGTCNNAATTYEVIFPAVYNDVNAAYVYYGNSSATNAEIDSTSYTALTPSGGDPSITTRTNEEKGPGPVGYWKFDEGVDNTCSGGTNDACDSTSNTNDGAMTGGTWQTRDMCVSGKCLFFDGSADNVAIGSSVNLTTEFTISHWLRTSQTGNQIYTVGNAGSGNGYRFGITGGKVAFLVGNATAHTESTCGTKTVNDNRWHLITGVYKSGNTFDCYIDGNFEASVSVGDFSGMSTSAPGIGAPPCCIDYKGFLDEVKIYPYARTAAQIKTDFQKNNSTPHGASASFGGGQGLSLSDGLVGYWKMDEASANTCTGGVNDSCDSSGNGNDGAWNGNTANTSGVFGNATSYDGTGDYTDLGSPTALDITGALTISAWINPSALTGETRIAGDEDSNWCGYLCGGYSLDTTNGSDLRLMFGDGNTGGNSGNWDAVTASSVLSTGSWQHVVGVWDGTTNPDSMKIYVNGVLKTQATATKTSISHGTPNIGIGGHHQSSGVWTEFFDGSIDEVRIYNRSLSPVEVEKLYNWAPGPVGYWNFDENTGTTTTYDRSGNANNGTMNGSMTESDWVPGKFGSALDFDGTDDYLNITDTAILDITNSITVNAWVKIDAAGGNNLTENQYIVAKTNSETTAAQHAYSLHIVNATNDYLTFEISDGTSYDRTGSTSSTRIQNLSTDTWYFLTGAYDGSNLYLYIDGDLKASKSTTLTSINTNNYDLRIGRRADNTREFDGQIDDVHIYNYARTPKQIIEDMNAGHPAGGSPVASPLLHLKLDEGYGTVANDVGYNSDNGDLIDGPTWSSSGKINKSVSLDGLNDRIQGFTSNPFEYTGGDLTLSAWVYQNSTETDTGNIFSKPWNGGGQYNYRLYVNGNDTLTFLLYGNASWSTTTTETLPTDTWTHLAVSVNGTDDSVKIYKNGELIKSDTYTITNWTPTSGDQDKSLTIGSLYPYSSGWAGNTTFSFDGKLDETKVYTSALSASEILIDMNASSQAAFSVLGSSEAADITDGAGNAPVAHYDFNENAGTSTVYDKGSLQDNGVMNNFVESDWVQGKYGSALHFTGNPSTDYVRLDNGTFNYNDVSVTAWIKSDNIAQTTQHFFGTTIGDTSDRLMLTVDSVVDGDVTVKVYDDIDNRGTYLSSSVTAPVETWIHVAFTCSSTSGKTLYINGVQGLSDSDVSCFDDISTRITTIGGYWYSGAVNANAFAGDIDEFKVYDYALTPAQVAYDYNRGRPVGWWRLDECQGTTAYDASGNGNNGTITIGATGTNTSAGSCSSGIGTEAWNNGTTGKRNASLDFDGTDDYIIITDPSSGILDFGTSSDFSLALWLKWSTGDGKYILAKRYAGATIVGYNIETGTGGNSGKLLFHIVDTDGTNLTATSAVTTDDNTWHHVVVTANRDGVAQIYIDGKPSGNSLSLSTIGNISNAYDLNIGSSTIETTLFDGQIDDIRIYNYALSATQIKKIMNEGANRFGPLQGNP